VLVDVFRGEGSDETRVSNKGDSFENGRWRGWIWVQ